MSTFEIGMPAYDAATGPTMPVSRLFLANLPHLLDHRLEVLHTLEQHLTHDSEDHYILLLAWHVHDPTAVLLPCLSKRTLQGIEIVRVDREYVHQRDLIPVWQHEIQRLACLAIGLPHAQVNLLRQRFSRSHCLLYSRLGCRRSHVRFAACRAMLYVLSACKHRSP